jgi:hypothetical protein
MAVYFIAIPTLEFVKVGFAANPRIRLKELQTGNPFDLSILATVPQAGFRKEAELHATLDRWGARQRGEWFWGPAVCELLLNGGDSDLAYCKLFAPKSSIALVAERYRKKVMASAAPRPELTAVSRAQVAAKVLQFQIKPVRQDWRDHLIKWLRAAEKEAPGGLVFARNFPKICGVASRDVSALIGSGDLPAFELELAPRSIGWRRSTLIDHLELAEADRFAKAMLERIGRSPA